MGFPLLVSWQVSLPVFYLAAVHWFRIVLLMDEMHVYMRSPQVQVHRGCCGLRQMLYINLTLGGHPQSSESAAASLLNHGLIWDCKGSFPLTWRGSSLFPFGTQFQIP